MPARPFHDPTARQLSADPAIVVEAVLIILLFMPLQGSLLSFSGFRHPSNSTCCSIPSSQLWRHMYGVQSSPIFQLASLSVQCLIQCISRKANETDMRAERTGSAEKISTDGSRASRAVAAPSGPISLERVTGGRRFTSGLAALFLSTVDKLRPEPVL